MSGTPYEEPILADIKRVLQGIRKANGYATDIGTNVFVEDERKDPDFDEPYLNVLDGEEELVVQDAHVRQVRLLVDIEVVIPSKRRQARSEARQVFADIRLALLEGLRQESYSQRIVNMTLQGRALPPMPAGARTQIGAMTVAFEMREEIRTL